MPRRRRADNSRIFRILGVSLLVNAVLITVAAQFGAFRAIQRTFGDTKVVLISPKDVPAEKEKPVQRKKVTPKTAPSRKGAGNPHRGGPSHPNPNQPKVVAGPQDTSGTGDAPTADAGGTLAPGSIPVPPGAGGSVPKSPETVVVRAPIIPPTKPIPKDIVPPTTPPAVAVPLKFEDCTPATTPSPELPDDLRGEPLDKDFIAEFRVDANGVPESVKTFQSTGIPALDELALRVAQKWRFHPATLGGKATNQTVRLKIEFRVP